MDDDEKYENDDDDGDDDDYDEENYRKRRIRRPRSRKRTIKRPKEIQDKEPTKEELQLVQFLEDLNQKLSFSSPKLKETEEPEVEEVEEPTESKIRRKSKELLELLNENVELGVQRKKSKSLTKVRSKTKSLTRLNDRLENLIGLPPAISKSSTRIKTRKSKSLTRLQVKKSKSLNKLGLKRVKSLNLSEPRRSGSLALLQSNVEGNVNSIKGLSPDYQKYIMNKIKRKSNWLYRNSFFIFGSIVIVGIIVWGVYSIIQDGIEREKCRQNGTRFCNF